jgi:hypothetical protein
MQAGVTWLRSVKTHKAKSLLQQNTDSIMHLQNMDSHAGLVANLYNTLANAAGH